MNFFTCLKCENLIRCTHATQTKLTFYNVPIKQMYVCRCGLKQLLTHSYVLELARPLPAYLFMSHIEYVSRQSLMILQLQPKKMLTGAN